MESPLGALALLILVAVCDAWVYLDARRRLREHRPVVASIGAMDLETPGQWLVACALLWVLFLPMYLVARSAP